jgi:hypothetical protein
VTIRPGRCGETLGFRAVEDDCDFEALWAAFRRICHDLGFEWLLTEFRARVLFERSRGRGVFFAWEVPDWVPETNLSINDAVANIVAFVSAVMFLVVGCITLSLFGARLPVATGVAAVIAAGFGWTHAHASKVAGFLLEVTRH